VPWEVVLLEEVDEWFADLVERDNETALLVTAAIDLLEDVGPTLGRPLVDRLEGSTIHNLKELRPGSSGASEVRIIFIFDPLRQAVLLVAGDKSRQWKEWYDVNIPIAESRYERWLTGEFRDEIGG